MIRCDYTLKNIANFLLLDEEPTCCELCKFIYKHSTKPMIDVDVEKHDIVVLNNGEMYLVLTRTDSVESSISTMLDVRIPVYILVHITDNQIELFFKDNDSVVAIPSHLTSLERTLIVEMYNTEIVTLDEIKFVVDRIPHNLRISSPTYSDGITINSPINKYRAIQLLRSKYEGGTLRELLNDAYPTQSN